MQSDIGTLPELKQGERYSEKYPGYIELEDGRLKTPGKQMNKARKSVVFKYYDIVHCACGKELLRNAYRRDNKPACSPECKAALIHEGVAQRTAATKDQLEPGERYSEDHSGYIEMPDGILKIRPKSGHGWNYYRKAECTVCGKDMLQNRKGDGCPVCSRECRYELVTESLRSSKPRESLEWQPDPRDKLGTREAWCASIEALAVINQWKRLASHHE